MLFHTCETCHAVSQLWVLRDLSYCLTRVTVERPVSCLTLVTLVKPVMLPHTCDTCETCHTAHTCAACETCRTASLFWHMWHLWHLCCDACETCDSCDACEICDTCETCETCHAVSHLWHRWDLSCCCTLLRYMRKAALSTTRILRAIINIVGLRALWPQSTRSNRSGTSASSSTHSHSASFSGRRLRLRARWVPLIGRNSCTWHSQKLYLITLWKLLLMSITNFRNH